MGGIVLRLRVMWRLVAAVVFVIVAATQASAGPTGTAPSGSSTAGEPLRMEGRDRPWAVGGPRKVRKWPDGDLFR